MTTISIYRPPTTLIVTVDIDEKTIYSKKLMGEHKITADFFSRSVLAIQIGDYITYNSENYYINRVPEVVKINNSTYQYKIDFEGVVNNLGRKLFISADGLADFSYNGNPTDFITNIVASINEIDSGWTVGTIDSADEQTLIFANESCRMALTRVAEAFKMEFEVIGREISMRASVGSNTGYTFRYGKGLGLYKLTRQQVSDQNIVTKVYGFGGTRNIPYDYRSRARRLVFEDRYLEKNTSLYGVIEGQFTDDNIYPKRTANITDVNIEFTAGVSGTEYNPLTGYIEDSTLDFDINDYLLEGQTAKVVFKSGDLSGVECEIWKYDNTNKRIYLNPSVDPDGYTLPFYNSGSPILPTIGDSYTLVDMAMPASYVTAAETELEAATQAYINENAVPMVVYSVEIDPKYAKDISLDIDAGDRVTIIDTALSISNLIRVSAIEFPLVNPYAIKAVIADFVPYTLQERVVKAAIQNKKEIIITGKKASESNWLNQIRQYQAKGRVTMPMYRGLYSAASTYYGNPARIDIVKYDIPADIPDEGEIYYVARADAPSDSFTGIAPTNTDYWKPFPATVEMLATGLFFAELAFIENLGVKHFQGIPIESGDLAGSVVNTQANVALSPQWDIGTSYIINDQVSNDGTNYICMAANTGQEPPNPTYWDEDTPAQSRIDTITLTGTGGTANILCNGLTRVASFDTSLIKTAANFAAFFSSDYSAIGVIVTSDGEDIIFRAAIPGTDFTGSTSITNFVSAYRGSIRMDGNEIWEPTQENDTYGYVIINRKGFNEGFGYYRHTAIYNGKDQPLIICVGSGTHGTVYLDGDYIHMPYIPTSNAGLGSGSIYRDGAGADATLKIK